MNYKIRFAILEDAPEIVRLIKELVNLSGNKTTLNEELVKDYLQTPDHHILVAQSSTGSVVGLTSYMYRKNLQHNGRICQLDDLVVNWGHQNRGLGSALLQQVIKNSRQAGCVAILLVTSKENQAAQRFVKQHGFVDGGLLMDQHLTKG